MREAYGSTWTLGLVLLFTIIFASYLAVSISYQMSFKLKNEVLGFIEREEGLTISSHDGKGAMPLINNYLQNSGYKQRGVCPEGWIGIKSLSSDISSNDYEYSDGGATKYFYCVNKVKVIDNVHPLRAYYEVRLFYKFDLPVIGDIYTFEVDGETNEIAIPGDSF